METATIILALGGTVAAVAAWGVSLQRELSAVHHRLLEVVEANTKAQSANAEATTRLRDLLELRLS